MVPPRGCHESAYAKNVSTAQNKIGQTCPNKTENVTKAFLKVDSLQRAGWILIAHTIQGFRVKQRSKTEVFERRKKLWILQDSKILETILYLEISSLRDNLAGSLLPLPAQILRSTTVA